MVEIFREYRLECAHYLPAMPDDHKCRRLHGHSYKIVIKVDGEPDPRTGMICDFADMDEAWQDIHSALDHRTLNDIGGQLENPTAENLAVFIYARWITIFSAGAREVTVWETDHAGATYRRRPPTHTHPGFIGADIEDTFAARALRRGNWE